MYKKLTYSYRTAAVSHEAIFDHGLIIRGNEKKCVLNIVPNDSSDTDAQVRDRYT